MADHHEEHQYNPRGSEQGRAGKAWVYGGVLFALLVLGIILASLTIFPG